MAEEKKLTTEEKLDQVLRVAEKIDKAQDLTLLSPYTLPVHIVSLRDVAEPLIRKLIEETQHL